MPADTPPPDRDRRDLRVIEPAAGEPAEPHAAFEHRERGAPVLKAAVVVILVGGSAGVIGYAYLNSGGPGGHLQHAGAPVVRPPDGPIKVRPEDPGGATVPYQDTLLLNRNGGEEVLEAAPEPQRPAVDWAAVAADAGTAPAADDAAEAAGAPPTPDRKPGGLGRDAPEESADTATAAQTPETATDRTGGAFAVQVAALREKAEARAVWQRVRDAHPEVLGELRLLLQRADLEDRGVFWRVRGGPFASRGAAESVCSRLKADGQGCFVVERR
ncbi:Cell division protein DedD (protein involved in septation) [Limimonas halophila]|uniref:Cell division protein DedD (Protein involved in septation) n=1 Tax=Limimonas halophila TaxID=1082479 RepID=A0A1G7NG30_9PROT|nr:SPOR domain-containing protein [Limimonas halophila]SDF73055.1 Cell division protein DedD (protein involved in septation) [Limimonas halophila]